MNTNLLPCILIDYLDIVIINKNEPPTKKPRQARCETKSKEKRLLEPLVTCSEYLNNKQIEEVEKY
ncbi:hypothetical protein GLOIN_2v1882833 [Rhizophagus irregularis DAOM 181602=DAOM 197198]|nr:hypothetical protein GLOIN_2v1882833 [Rhizophagus irregularis DAOM 181602=DAOM 197198]